MMNSDMDLVEQYARGRSEEAFATLVSRHVSLVYSVALRQVGDPHLAEEITQSVFIILASKAASLRPGTVVSGWLYRTARFACARAMTMRRRRLIREQEAYMRSQLNQPETNPWIEIEPLLDPAMGQLGENEHNAVVLRYFEGRSFKEVGAALGTTEAGAKMRVNRALERLRRFFGKRGIALSSAAIATAISTHSVQAAPIGLAVSVKAAALQGAVVTSSTLTLIKTTLKLMAWTKLKSAALVGAIALLAAGVSTVVIQTVSAQNNAAKGADKKSSFRFAGYATPEASVQSMMWLASRGEWQKLPATTEEMERFKGRMQGKSEAEIRDAAIAWAHALIGYRITETEVISDNEVHLHMTAPVLPDGLVDGRTISIMRRVGDEWKFDGKAPY